MRPLNLWWKCASSGLLKQPQVSPLLSMQMREFGKKNKMYSYKQIPDWLSKQERDPFDYKLRSKEEVMEEQKYFPPAFAWKTEVSSYPSGDTRQHLVDKIEDQDRIARIKLDLREFNFAPLQRERFIFLLGPRYIGGHFFKIICKQYQTWDENYVRALEQLREIYWESLRAPDHCVTMQRNPYRREFLIKKMMGKTKVERRQTKQNFKKQLAQNKIEIDKQLMEQELEIQHKKDSGRGRRVDIAKRRAKLGFNDKGATEVEDADIDRIENQIKSYKSGGV